MASKDILFTQENGTPFDEQDSKEKTEPLQQDANLFRYKGVRNNDLISQKKWGDPGIKTGIRHTEAGTPFSRCVVSDRYNMNHSRRGVAIVMNNGMFQPPNISDRRGYHVDGGRMKDTLKSMGFDVYYGENMSKNECINILRKVSSADHSQADCLVLVFMSHGNHDDQCDYIWTTDSIMYISELTSFFTPDYCPSMAAKPKLFFIQACRGDDADEGWRTLGQAEGDEPDAGRMKQKIPLMADILLAQSTYPGFTSFRSERNGSVWINYLTEVLNEHNRPDCEHDILQLLTQVNQRMALEFQTGEMKNDPAYSNMKQMPTFTSTLTKGLFLAKKVRKYDTQV